MKRNNRQLAGNIDNEEGAGGFGTAFPLAAGSIFNIQIT